MNLKFFVGQTASSIAHAVRDTRNRVGTKACPPYALRFTGLNSGEKLATAYSPPKPIPPWEGRMLGNPESVERLVGSLRIHDELIREELGWRPGFTVQQGAAGNDRLVQ